MLTTPIGVECGTDSTFDPFRVGQVLILYPGLHPGLLVFNPLSGVIGPAKCSSAFSGMSAYGVRCHGLGGLGQVGGT